MNVISFDSFIVAVSVQLVIISVTIFDFINHSILAIWELVSHIGSVVLHIGGVLVFVVNCGCALVARVQPIATVWTPIAL
jgi:hypothetical protein